MLLLQPNLGFEQTSPKFLAVALTDDTERLARPPSQSETEQNRAETEYEVLHLRPHHFGGRGLSGAGDVRGERCSQHSDVLLHDRLHRGDSASEWHGV